MNEIRFAWPASMRPVVFFACAVVTIAWMLPSPAYAASPRGYFTNATNVGPLSGVEAFHFIPAVSPDHLTLYFCDSDRGDGVPLPGNYGLEDVWVATRTNTDEPFSNVQNLGPAINTSNSEVLGSVSADELTLYFSHGGTGNVDIYQATRASVDGPFTSVVSLGPGVNTPDEQAMPFVTSDGLTLVYQVAPAGMLTNGAADVDIWMATRQSTEQQFGNARSLAMNSTSADDWFPSLSGDGLTLFTSDWIWQGERPGSPGYYSTWVSTRESEDDPFGMPVLITDLWPDSEFDAQNIANSFISQEWPAPGSKLYWADHRYPNSSAVDIFQASWVPFEDCDFNGDGSCGIADIDGLITEIAAGTNGPIFDLTGDSVVDLADRDAWLAQAGVLNLPSGNAFLVADFNLDGTVDGQDFIAWNDSKFSPTAKWSLGDANGDGVTDGQDFIAWNQNKFQSADGFSAVPEPAATTLLMIAMLAVSVARGRS